MQKVFKLYCKTEDDTILMSRLISEGEDLFNAFNEKNFSNNEIGVLMKLRKSRHALYEDAFSRFNKNRKHDDLVSRLKDLVDDNLQLSSTKPADPFNGKLQVKTHEDDQINNYLIRQRTR